MRGTVLLVEDEEDTREVLARALERAGYRCFSAHAPESAIEHASRGEFIDTVVTDVVLDSDDRAGLTLIGRLRAAGVRAPVIVITAYADLEKVKVALNEGASHLLEKPFRAADLLEAIERVHAQGDVSHAVERVFVHAGLTEKECVVARHLLLGLSSAEIAKMESNSPKTIRQHVSQIYAKCGVSSRAEFFRLVYSG